MWSDRARPPTEALQLVPFAKAYSGLTDEEFAAVDARHPRDHDREIRPGAQRQADAWCSSWDSRASTAAPRHKSGIAVRFPRMLRIRDDKPIAEADTLQTLETLLALG